MAAENEKIVYNTDLSDHVRQVALQDFIRWQEKLLHPIIGQIRPVNSERVDCSAQIKAIVTDLIDVEKSKSMKATLRGLHRIRFSER